MSKLTSTATAIVLMAFAQSAIAQEKAPSPAQEKAPAPAVQMKDAAPATRVEPRDQPKVAANGEYYTTTEKTDFLASKLIGTRVYVTEANVDPSKTVDKVSADWKDIGEINNIVVGRDGSVRAVVLGVGGFLGIGEKDVAVQMASLNFVKKIGDAPSDYFIVVRGSKESLQSAPTYKY